MFSRVPMVLLQSGSTTTVALVKHTLAVLTEARPLNVRHGHTT